MPRQRFGAATDDSSASQVGSAMIKIGERILFGGKTPKAVEGWLKVVRAAVATDKVRRRVNEVSDQVEEKLHQAGVATVDLKKLKEFRRKMGL